MNECRVTVDGTQCHQVFHGMSLSYAVVDLIKNAYNMWQKFNSEIEIPRIDAWGEINENKNYLQD